MAPSSAESVLDGAPVFYLYGDDRPSVGALLNGGAASVFVFMLISLLIGVGVNHRHVFIVGSHHPSPSHMLAAQSAAEPQDLPSEVKVKTYPDRIPIEPYFKLLLVLKALDIDEDNVISAGEIANAPAALRRLDKNHDGGLSPEECGFRFGDSARAKLRFMQFHPVNAALDADSDGSISAREINHAAESLSRLDSNHDGTLTLFELLPHPGAR
jgi:Ca2+-binding EF-hand superfamily protein